MAITKIIIVDDHPAISYGTKIIIEQNLNYQVVDVIHAVNEVVDSVMRHHPQIMFVDMHMPQMNGRELTTLIKQISPRTHVVIFSGYDLIPMWNQLIQAGVSGIMSKNATPDQILRMIASIVAGETVIPVTLLNRLVYNDNASQLLQTIELTEREQSIMQMVCDGMSNQSLSQQLIVSTRTVENYLSRIYQKMGVRTRSEAIEAFKSRY
jgi:DNA-binding NarL/FixJ family response regulator